ncbi:hypothetical protein [Mesoplasma seiffertii]|uniref:hypothetical protein n=1 Tax=Mesoplasma seiffertii TaxID=28224 RepID=UPI00047A6FB5|nr:hypothetical protein [Mesoplasma seiffertii]
MKKLIALLGIASIAGAAAVTPIVIKSVNAPINNKDNNSENEVGDKTLIKFLEVKEKIKEISQPTYANFDKAVKAFEELNNDLYKVKTEINQESLTENTKANGYYICDISVTPSSQAAWEDETIETIKFTTTVSVDERESFSEQEVKQIIEAHLKTSFTKEAPKTILETKKTILATANQPQNFAVSEGILINKVANEELTQKDQTVNEVVKFTVSVSLKNNYKWGDTNDGSVKTITIEQRVDGRQDIDFDKEVAAIKKALTKKNYDTVKEFESEVNKFKSLGDDGIKFTVEESSKNDEGVPIFKIDSKVVASIDSKNYRWLGQPDDNADKTFDISSISIDNRTEISYEEVEDFVKDFISKSANNSENSAQLFKIINDELDLSAFGAVVTTLEYNEKTNVLKIYIGLERMYKWTDAREEHLNGTTQIAAFTIGDVAFVNKTINYDRFYSEFKEYMSDMSEITTNAEIESKANAFLESSDFKDKVEIIENSLLIQGDLVADGEVLFNIAFKAKEGYKWSNGTSANGEIPIMLVLTK